MRSRLVRMLLALSLVGLVALTTSPAPAASAYEMYGGGTLAAAPDGVCLSGNNNCSIGTQVPGQITGMPACTRFTEYGNVAGDTSETQNCNSDKVTNWTFGGLPIVSKGVLFDHPQAATYNCGASTVSTTGGTDNFRVNFSFNCVRENGVGWNSITGFFATCGANPCGPGRPYWEGQFFASGRTFGTGPSSGGPVPMRCSGMFEPGQIPGQGNAPFGSNGQGPTVTNVFFEGECTAAG